ncbi:hypothetical protein Tco_0078303 [Tanacetum coccineum]
MQQFSSLKILDICLRVPNEDFIVPPPEESLINFLYELGYKGHINKLAKSFPLYDNDNTIPEPDVALELGKSISKTEVEIAEEARHVHETHERLVTIKPTGVDESDREPANRPTRRRRPSGITFRDTLNLSKPARKHSDYNNKHEDSSEGAGITPEVPDDLTGKFTPQVKELVLYQSPDDEYVNRGEITWLSTNEEEKGNEDDDEEDDDKNQAEDDIVGTSYHFVTEREILCSRSSLAISDFKLVLVIPPQKTTTTTPTPLITPIPTTPIASTTQHVTSLLPVTKTPDALVPPSEALTAVLQRVLTLEKDVKELKQVDHYAVILKSIRSQVPPAVNEFLRSSLGDSLQQSYEKHPTHKELYDTLILSLFVDEEDMDKAAAVMGQYALMKRKHEDQGEDPTIGSDQWKDKKKPRKDT